MISTGRCNLNATPKVTNIRVHSLKLELEVIVDEIVSTIVSKNEQYGDSALNPLRVFSRADRLAQIDVRIDDKLSRIARGNGKGNEDAELDLIGYLLLKRVAKRFHNGGDDPDKLDLLDSA